MRKEEILKELETLKEIKNYRSLKGERKEVLNLSSNDYLGVACDEELRKEFYSNFSNSFSFPKLSSSSSRLIDGSYDEVMELEEKVEEIYGKPCIMFNSGFDANSSLIETFCNKKTLILTDRLNHASIYDGILNSGAEFLRYKHLDMESLEKLLIKYQGKYEDILVISETIYSMDGDIADVEKLVDLKRKYGFQLMIDEAHSYGVYGYGIVYNLKVVDEVDFLVIPLGKGGGSVGAMVICEEYLKEYIINKSRKFIFSTALPPINSAWNMFVLNKMESRSFVEKRERLERLKDYTLKLLKESGLETISTTHIISIVVGDNGRIEKIAKNMSEKGYFLYPVKEPTVPKGSARFRIGLNPNITFEEISQFVKELKNEIDTVF